jgi:hypothetical protein
MDAMRLRKRGCGTHRLFHAVVVVGLSVPAAMACGGSESSSTDGSPGDAASDAAEADSSVAPDSSSDSEATEGMVVSDAVIETAADAGAADAPLAAGDSGLLDAMRDADACLCCPHPCILI